jgi:SAM-dependent methyltransferase
MEFAEYKLMDEAEQGMWWYRALHARMLDGLAGVRGRVLDAGCGTGGLLARIGRVRPDLQRVGLEYEAKVVARAVAKSGAPIAAGSINAIPFADGVFDAVVSADVLCHAGVDPVAALAELRRVLKPGGKLVVNMPAFTWLMSAHDRRVHNVRRVSARALRGMLEAAGFASVRTRYWNGLLLPFMIVQRKLLASDADSASDVASFPPFVDAMFHGVTVLERYLPFALPAGGSVLATAVRA